MSIVKSKTMIILRGPSGSGKSTWANKQKNAHIYSADNYFFREDDSIGKIIYDYDPSELPKAHKLNRVLAKYSMKYGLEKVIIDNTNLSLWEMKPYVILGKKYDYDIQIKSFGQDLTIDKLVERSKKGGHNVPREKIEMMVKRYEKPSEYNIIEDILNSKRPFKVTVIGRYVNKIRKLFSD